MVHLYPGHCETSCLEPFLLYLDKVDRNAHDDGQPISALGDDVISSGSQSRLENSEGQPISALGHDVINGASKSGLENSQGQPINDQNFELLASKGEFSDENLNHEILEDDSSERMCEKKITELDGRSLSRLVCVSSHLVRIAEE